MAITNFKCSIGCLEIISANCVKYIGPHLSSIGVSSNDTLYTILTKIDNYLSSGAVGGFTVTFTNSYFTI